MIPYSRHSISKEEILFVSHQLKLGQLSRVKIIEVFEKKCSQMLSNYAVSCSSGSSAIEIALRAANIKNGDEVLVPNISWSSTATSVSLVGGIPIFCDIDKDFPNINLEEVKKKISKRTKAIIPVHFAGVPVNIEKLYTICELYGIHIIEDACHAFGGRYSKDKIIGSSKYTFASCFSFHPAKTITTGEGGLIATSKKSTYNKLLTIRSSGIVRKSKLGFKKSLYDCSMIGSNYHMTGLSAAIGICQLKKVNFFISKRKLLWNRYKKNLNNLKNINLFTHTNHSSFNLCILKVSKKKRLNLINYLTKHGIGVFFHYPEIRLLSLYKQKIYSKIKYKKKDFINSWNYTRSSITLPLFPSLLIKDVDRICDVIKNFNKKFKL